MAEFTRNRIYTYVRNALKAVYPDLYVTAMEEPIPPKGPAVQVREVVRRRPVRDTTLDGKDDQLRVAFDVNVYSNLSNGALDEAHEIMSVAEQAFKEIYFIETDCRPLELANNRVTRLVARFDRVIGKGDQFPD